MHTESFYGVTLSEKEPLAQFEVSESDEVLDQKLVIKQAMLGDEAKTGEFNVIQAETKVSDTQTLKIPIAVLKVGETRCLRPDVEFPCASVTFKLIQGTGPVHIYGQHVVNTMDETEECYGDEDDIEDEDDEDIAVQYNGKNGKNK